jgi:hypothetical protein
MCSIWGGGGASNGSLCGAAVAFLKGWEVPDGKEFEGGGVGWWPHGGRDGEGARCGYRAARAHADRAERSDPNDDVRQRAARRTSGMTIQTGGLGR